MNKKVIIGIVCAVVCVVIIALVVVLALGASSPKKTAKDLGKALQSADKLETFMLKNVDFKAECAAEELVMGMFTGELSEEDVSSPESYKKAMTEKFEEYYKEVDEEKINESKEDMKETIHNEGSSSLSSYIKEGTKFVKAEKLVDSKFLPMFQIMNVTYEQDGKEVEYSLYFYKKKLVTVELKSQADLMEEAMASAFSGEEE